MDHRFRFRILALEITSPKLTNKETGLERLSQLVSDMRNGAFFLFHTLDILFNSFYYLFKAETDPTLLASNSEGLVPST